MTLAEGFSRAVSTDQILSSMETIARSHIQKHVTMTPRFADILRGSGGASPVPVVAQEPAGDYAAPTRDNMRVLARESAVVKPAPQKLNPAAPSFTVSSQGTSQGPTSSTATFGGAVVSVRVTGPASTPPPLTQQPLPSQWQQQQQSSSMPMAPVQSSSGSSATFSALNSSVLPKSTQTMDTCASASMSATGTFMTRSNTIPSTPTITANFAGDAKLNDEVMFVTSHDLFFG